MENCTAGPENCKKRDFPVDDTKWKIIRSSTIEIDGLKVFNR